MIDAAKPHRMALPPCNDASWLPWLAALIDGAGTIAISRHWGVSGWGYAPVILVRSPHQELLEQALAVGGAGRIRLEGGRDGAPVFAWEAHGGSAAAILAAVRPYLLAQIAHADRAIRVQLLNAYYAPDTRPADIAARLDALYEEARPLLARSPRRLTIEQIRAIRALKGTASQRDIAARFGVNLTTVRNILAGRDSRGLAPDAAAAPEAAAV